MTLPLWRQLRVLAVAESWALRLLLRAHGRLPVTAQTCYSELEIEVEAGAFVQKEREHGTLLGYRQHLGRAEPACDACSHAFIGDIAHGTDRGYHQHRRRGVPSCPPCDQAHALDKSIRQQRRKTVAA